MMLFFFGTLMDDDVRTAVIGRAVPPEHLHPCTVGGVRRVFVAGRTYPMLVPMAGGIVDGIAVEGLSKEEIRRLCDYEGDEYRLCPIEAVAADGSPLPAQAFLCHGQVKPDRRDWRLEDWQQRHKRGFLERTRAMMARCGHGAGTGVGVAAAAEQTPGDTHAQDVL